MPASLSVVIPSYRRADLLELCLQSVTRFAPAGTEIVVVDDGSDDATISETALRFPQVRTIRLARQHGFCIAANIGIASATAPIVELLNDDTEVTAGWAEAALDCFRDSDIVSVAPLVLLRDAERETPERIDSAGDVYHRGGYAQKRWHNRVRAELGELKTEPVWGASAAAAFYRRDAVLSAGGFPDDFGAYFEDVDLAHRLNRNGGRTLFQPGSVVWHRVSASYGRIPSRDVLIRQSRNEERVFWRNIPGIYSAAFDLPHHAAVLAGKAVRRLREGTFRPWLQGRMQAWFRG